MHAFGTSNGRSIRIHLTITIFIVELNARLPDGLSATDRHQLLDGLGRSLVSEDFTRKFVTLVPDDLGRDLGYTTDVIFEIVRRVAESAIEGLKTNYAAARGMLRISHTSENIPWIEEVVKGLYRASRKDASSRAILRLRFT